MSRAVITKDKFNIMMNKISHARSEKRVSSLFTDNQVNWLRQKYTDHMDSDAAGLPEGVTPTEAEEVNQAAIHPTPLDKIMQGHYGIKHGFDQEQLEYLRKVEDEELRY